MTGLSAMQGVEITRALDLAENNIRRASDGAIEDGCIAVTGTGGVHITQHVYYNESAQQIFAVGVVLIGIAAIIAAII